MLSIKLHQKNVDAPEKQQHLFLVSSVVAMVAWHICVAELRLSRFEMYSESMFWEAWRSAARQTGQSYFPSDAFGFQGALESQHGVWILSASGLYRFPLIFFIFCCRVSFLHSIRKCSRVTLVKNSQSLLCCSRELNRLVCLFVCLVTSVDVCECDSVSQI